MGRKIWIGSDHAGYELKERLAAYLKASGIEVVNVGTHSGESVHYPSYGFETARRMLEGSFGDERLQPRAIVVCGSGVGVSISANRLRGVRAVLALREDVAALSRQHNASNVLCLGARLLSLDEACRIVDVWLSTDFEGGRHADRIRMLDELPADVNL